MSEWKTVPAELAARFDAALPVAADVQRRQMFGCPWAFVNGNMFAGLHEGACSCVCPLKRRSTPR